MPFVLPLPQTCLVALALTTEQTSVLEMTSPLSQKELKEQPQQYTRGVADEAIDLAA